jgi:serine/threonine protein kinase
MPVVEHLCCFALKQFGGDGFDAVGKLLSDRFSDHGKQLLKALDRSNRRAWRSLEIALTGESFWHRITDKADDRGLRQQMRLFLDKMPLPEMTDKHPYYKQCVQDLKAALKKGTLLGEVVPAALLAKAGAMGAHSNPQHLLQLEKNALTALAATVQAEGFRALGWMLNQPAVAGDSIVVVAVQFFFRREVESNPQLAAGLQMTAVQTLGESQAEAFGQLGSCLDRFEDRVDTLLAEAQEAILSAVAELKATIEGGQGQTHAKLDSMHEDFATMSGRMDKLLERLDLLNKPVQPRHSLSIQNDRERQLVKEILMQYRGLPEETKRGQPEVGSKMGKLLMAAGEYQSAEQLFAHSAKGASSDKARAEAHHNTYRAALEQHHYDAALRELLQAAAIDPERFSLLPEDRYEAERILGAGGFGVTLLCKHRLSGGHVAIKSLTMDDLATDGATVLSEANILEQLHHPAIIGVRDCGYADRHQKRPYVIMEYFEGRTLEEHVQKDGPLPLDEVIVVARLLAQGFQAAHAKQLLHRDIKPANILLRETDDKWEVRIIDFGLALKDELLTRTGSTSRQGKTIVGSSISGTIDYAAPEQLGKLPGVRVGAPADVYGFGRTLNFALFGIPELTLHQYRKLPPAVADFLSLLVQPRPEDRPQSFGDVLRSLKEAVSSDKRQTTPPPLDLPEAIPEPRRRAPVAEAVEVRDEEPRPRRRPREEDDIPECTSGTRITHAILAWFLAPLGIHKFVQGNNNAGLIRLAITCTLVGVYVNAFLGFIEMIIYLTKSNEDYARIYLRDKKSWF